MKTSAIPPNASVAAQRPRAWLDRLPFAPQFRRSRLAVLLLRALCALRVRQEHLEAFARREPRHG